MPLERADNISPSFLCFLDLGLQVPQFNLTIAKRRSYNFILVIQFGDFARLDDQYFRNNSLVFLVAGGLAKVVLALGFFKIEVERSEAA